MRELLEKHCFRYGDTPANYYSFSNGISEFWLHLDNETVEVNFEMEDGQLIHLHTFTLAEKLEAFIDSMTEYMEPVSIL